jgi:hypothetical protein
VSLQRQPELLIERKVTADYKYSIVLSISALISDPELDQKEN